MLTDRQIEDYRRDGYLVIPRLIEGEQLAELRALTDRIVAEARNCQADRERGYRAQALKMYPWVCGRCARDFTLQTVSELTVHHRDHNHDNNPTDGSNWELLCIYCHENEHARVLDQAGE